MSKEAKSPKIFYGWFVVAACFAMILVAGGNLWTFGVFFKPLQNEFGWSRTLVSSGSVAFLIGHAVSLATAGRLVDKYRPRPIVLASALLVGFGLFLCSQIHSINQLRIFLFTVGLGTGANWSIPTTSVQRWFHKRQRAGLALAIVVTGIGVGALIFAPLNNHLILNYGWRNTFIIVGIIFFIIIVLSSLVISQSSAGERTPPQREISGPKSVSAQDWTMGRVVTTRPFIAITFINCIIVVVFQGVIVHCVPHAIDVGISPSVSAAALGFVGGISVLGRIMGGLMSGRMGWQKILAVAFFGVALSLLWLIFLETAWMLYCFVFFFGICHGSLVPAQLGILGEFFGMRSLGGLIGISTAISFFIGAFSPYMVGFVFDTTGSYFWAFIIVMVLALGGGLAATIMRKPSVALE